MDSIYGGNSTDASASIVDLDIDQDEVRKKVGKLSTNKKDPLITELMWHTIPDCGYWYEIEFHSLEKEGLSINLGHLSPIGGRKAEGKWLKQI